MEPAPIPPSLNVAVAGTAAGPLLPDQDGTDDHRKAQGVEFLLQLAMLAKMNHWAVDGSGNNVLIDGTCPTSCIPGVIFSSLAKDATLS